MPKYITENLEIISDESDIADSDYSNKKDSDEENSKKQNNFQQSVTALYWLSNFWVCIKSIQHFFIYIKMQTEYSQNYKERIGKEARERHHNLSEEEKNIHQKRIAKDIKTLLKTKNEKKHQYYRQCNKFLLEDQK